MEEGIFWVHLYDSIKTKVANKVVFESFEIAH